MGKYSRVATTSTRKKEINPIWRGIGCLLIIFVPLLSFGIMLVLVPSLIATGLIPYQLLGYVQFPEWIYQVPLLVNIAIFIGSINNLWLGIITFLVIVLILSGVSSLVYSMVYSLVGPERYSEFDAPPSRHKPKKYTR